MEHTTFTVKGMKCEHCEARVEQALKNTDGVAAAKADRAKCAVEVDYDPAAVTPTAQNAPSRSTTTRQPSPQPTSWTV